MNVRKKRHRVQATCPPVDTLSGLVVIVKELGWQGRCIPLVVFPAQCRKTNLGDSFMRVAVRSKCVLLSLAVSLLLTPGAFAALSNPDASLTGPAKAQPAISKVNVNTAGVAELQTLPGIGPALAGRVVAYREENGPFRSVEDLLAVKGIGARLVTKLRDRVTVGGDSKKLKPSGKS